MALQVTKTTSNGLDVSYWRVKKRTLMTHGRPRRAVSFLDFK